MDNNFDLKKFDKVLADIAEIQERGNFIPDCSTKAGYEASKRFVLDVTTPARKQLEQAHKDTKKPFWDACKFLDSKKKELMPILEAIEEPHKQAYRAVDEERKRIKAEKETRVQKGFDDINALVASALGAASQQIEALLSECADFDVDPEVYGERTGDLVNLHSEAMEKLSAALTSQIQLEEIQKREEELRIKQEAIEKAEAEQKARELEEARIKREKEVAEQAKAEAERKAKEEIELQKALAEQQAKEAEERAKQAAIEAENKRLADIEAAKRAEIQRQKDEADRLKAEAEAREANKKYLAKVHNAILDVLVDNGISEKDGRTMIKLAAKGELPQLTINY
jgi:hypothetical protein